MSGPAEHASDLRVGALRLLDALDSVGDDLRSGPDALEAFGHAVADLVSVSVRELGSVESVQVAMIHDRAVRLLFSIGELQQTAAALTALVPELERVGASELAGRLHAAVEGYDVEDLDSLAALVARVSGEMAGLLRSLVDRAWENADLRAELTDAAVILTGFPAGVDPEAEDE